jgi:pimeloyl-ACP methyl ester carboxylesterase
VTCGAGRRVEANGLGLQLHEWRGGGRPPALLLHSLAANSHWWDWAARVLASRFDVVALDFRGHGGSDHARPPAYRFDDHVGDVAAVLGHLGWTAPLVVGHSMGAYVAASLAARHPDRVGALVIADMLTSWSEEMDRRAKAQAVRRSVFGSAQDAAARFRLTPPETAAPPERLEHLGRTSVTERQPGAWEPAFDRQVFLHPPPDPWPFLPDVEAPTLVLRGAASAVMSGEAAACVAAAVRMGEVVEIPGTFHHLVVDDPDAVARAILRWIGRVGGRARC